MRANIREWLGPRTRTRDAPLARIRFAAMLAVLTAACGSTAALGTGPSPVKCQPALTGLPASIPAAGARVSARVSTTADCGWRLTTDGAWIQIAPESGVGEASISVVFAPNTDRSPRSATIGVDDASVSISVSQEPAAAAPAPSPPPRGPDPPPPPRGPGPSPDPPPPDPSPIPGEQVELEGTIKGLRGRCPDVSFTIDATTVRVDEDTQVRQGSCKDLKNGRLVLVAGRRAPDGSVLAERVDIEKK